MRLGALIRALELADQEAVLPIGFGAPMSFRGIYEDLAFEPAENVSVASMLAHARSALGATFGGYKGGDFTMDEHTTCWIAEYGSGSENPRTAQLSETLLALMLRAGQRKSRRVPDPW